MNLGLAVIPAVLVGILLLVLGRQLFWLFVAVVGFLVGMQIAPQLVPNQPQSTVLIISLVLGVIGALLAMFVQRLAVGLAGFLLGGYILANLAAGFGLNTGSLPGWLLFLIGGVVGAILVVALFDWALIILSSIAGASLITQNIAVGSPTISLVLFLVLIAFGIIIQARSLGRRV